MAVALCGATLALGARVVLGPRAALSTAVGAGIAAGNLWALARIVTALLPVASRESGRTNARPDARAQRESGRTNASLWALLALLKMFGLFSVVWLLMRYRLVSPLSMLVGFGALPMGIAIGSLVSDRSASP
jgi:hypothetical protein